MKWTYGSYNLTGTRMNYVKVFTRFPKAFSKLLHMLTEQPLTVKGNAVYIQVTK